MSGHLMLANLAAILLTLGSCSTREGEASLADVPLQSSDERYSALPTLSVRLVGSIGSEIDSTGQYMFGRISDIQADSVGNVYVLDPGFREIKIFRDRTLVRTIPLPEGRGPGEFITPIKFAVAQDGSRIVVVDRSPPQVTTLGSAGEYHSRFMAHRPYFKMELLPGGKLLQVQMPMALRKDEHLIRTLLPDGSETGISFGYRQEDYESLFDEGIRSGIPEVRVDLLDGLLFVGFGYPYEVQVWSSDGELRGRHTRSIAGFNQTIEEGQFLLKRGQISCVAARRDSLLVVFAHDSTTDDTRISMYDFAGARRGEILASKVGGLTLPRILSCAFDSSGRLYVTSTTEYPSISVLELSHEPFSS